MDIMNMKVSHIVFGVGVVTEFDGKYVTVQFADKSCKFIYPDVFEKFIKAMDELLQNTIMQNIAATKQAAEEKRQIELAACKAEEKRKLAERQTTTSLVRKTRNIEEGFGPDYNAVHLARQQIFTYQQV